MVDCPCEPYPLLSLHIPQPVASHVYTNLAADTSLAGLLYFIQLIGAPRIKHRIGKFSQILLKERCFSNKLSDLHYNFWQDLIKLSNRQCRFSLDQILPLQTFIKKLKFFYRDFIRMLPRLHYFLNNGRLHTRNKYFLDIRVFRSSRFVVDVSLHARLRRSSSSICSTRTSAFLGLIVRPVIY